MNEFGVFQNLDRKSKLSFALAAFGTLIFLFTLPLSIIRENTITSEQIAFNLILSTLLAINLICRKSTSIQKNINQTSSSPASSTIWYILDIFMILPYSTIAFFAEGIISAELIVLIRCLDFFKLASFRDVLPWINRLSKPVKFSLLITVISLGIHSITCGWIYITGQSDVDFFTTYNKALYWSITTLTTVGYGDITPHSNTSRMYTIVVMLCGVTTFGIMISQFFRMMINKDKYSKHKDEQMEKLSSFLTYYEIPAKLKCDVYSFYGHILNKNITEEDSRIMSSLPNSLQEELNIYMKIKLIKKIHIFSKLSNECLKSVAENLEQNDYTPNSYILREGEIGTKMFIIAHGSVEVSSNGQVLATLQEGQFFGEIALLQKTRRVADIKTSEYCDLYTLNIDAFTEVTKAYPELRKHFLKIYAQPDDKNGSAA